MLTKEEIKKWLLENCVDGFGNLDLCNLDFSDFDGDINEYGWEVKGNLDRSVTYVHGNLLQQFQKVWGSLLQNMQTVDGALYQDFQFVGGELHQDKLEDEERNKE